MILDRFNRNHNYLRISLTDNCNLRCFYCMPEEDYLFTPNSRLMQPEEILQLASVFVSQGVDKIRLTGGEPLIRKDVALIIRGLGKLPVELTITTNGTRLHDFSQTLQQSGVKTVNISLDTLDRNRFLMVTKRDQFELVMNNIELMVSNGFSVKINVVVMKGLNDMEIVDFVAWTRNFPVEVRFIEFMPFSGNRWTSNQVVTWEQILAKVEERFTIIPKEREKNGTAKKYRVPGHLGTFAVISTMSANFCGDCNRMRLTADGKMKNCLFSTEETDLLGPLRSGIPIIPLIQACIHSKHKQGGGQILPDFENLMANSLENRTMIAIGG